jgi:hypothetical protein
VPVAVVDFECEYDGELICFKAGRDIVADRHEILRRFPHHFRSDPPAHGHARERLQQPPARSVHRSRGPGLPERWKVEFTKGARYDLDIALGEYDGLEVGGGLFGRLSGDSIVVECVGRQAWMRDRTSTRTEIPVMQCLELERSLGGPRWLGDWHTHDRGSGTPSDQDEGAWTNLRRDHGPGVWVGLIATPGPDPHWAMWRPRLHAWTVTDKGLKAANLVT